MKFTLTSMVVLISSPSASKSYILFLFWAGYIPPGLFYERYGKMKRTVKVKNLIAFAAVLILLFNITAIPAYAEFPPLTTAGRRLGSWILATLTAANITLTSTVAASQGADIINFLADPLDVNYSYTEMWNDRPTIQIWDDYTTIDGVTYTDVWLSNEAASKFKTDGMDFATAYSIASNTNGTFAKGLGTFKGMPVFDVNGNRRTQTGNFNVGDSFQYGDTTYTSGENVYADMHRMTINGTLTGMYYPQGQEGGSIIGKPAGFYYSDLNQSLSSCYKAVVTPRYPNGNTYGGTTYGSGIVNPFDFDWVAGSIDTEPLEPTEGLMMRIPSDRIEPMKQFLVDNPEFGQPGGTTIDVNLDPDIMNKLDDLIDIIAPIIPVINNFGDVQFTVNHDAPIPPVPDTPIIDATVPQVVNPIINEITNYGDQITEQIPQIIETIPTINSICENIDTAPYHDLDTGLDHLPTVFLPFITDLRSALGIWHYVTEWISQISTTFAFVTGCLVGTSIMTPIYAAIAGFMCIKVYRRMTG